jgi:hypothetical protein
MPVPNFTAPNNDSQWNDFSGLYGKGLLQTAPGVVDAGVATTFVNEINRGKAAVASNSRPVTGAGVSPLFEVSGLVLGNNAASGRLNGPQGAFASQFLANGSQTYKTFAPPPVGGPYYAVELAELYWASLLRDVPFTEFTDTPTPGANPQHRKLIDAACKDLSDWAQPGKAYYLGPVDASGKVTPSLLFRGGVPAGKHKDFSTQNPQNDPNAYFSDEKFGPYLSQLCISQTTLGAQGIDQKIQTFMPGRDFMIDQASWFSSENGKPSTASLVFDPTPRHIRNGRDLSAYTHVDELYQAYLVAFLVLANSWNAAPNPGLPYSPLNAAPYTRQKAFCTMGGPEVAAFLGFVARAAIDAVWWQKWAVHLRARPEAGGGLVHLWKTGATNPPQAVAAFDATFGEIMANSLAASSARYSPHSAQSDSQRIFLLSQAFPEGSPTHPAFPTGHGTVAGACITALKFFFDGTQPIQALTTPVVPTADGLGLRAYEGADVADMTVNGELHKLAHNISFGHGVHAGIHWRTDTDESILLGEKVALDCLRTLAASYTEKVAAQITLMNGQTVTISN